MVDLKELQKKAYENKVKQGFNVTDIPMEFCYMQGELSEAFHAYMKKKDVGDELADVMIYILGLSEILEIDLEEKLLAKIEKNTHREYEMIDGVLHRTKEG